MIKIWKEHEPPLRGLLVSAANCWRRSLNIMRDPIVGLAFEVLATVPAAGVEIYLWIKEGGRIIGGFPKHDRWWIELFAAYIAVVIVFLNAFAIAQFINHSRHAINAYREKKTLHKITLHILSLIIVCAAHATIIVCAA